MSKKETSLKNNYETFFLVERLLDIGALKSATLARELIDQRAITINGKIVTNRMHIVSSRDHIKINNKLVINKEAPVEMYLFYKPDGCITATKNNDTRPTVFDYLPANWANKYVTIGRLDYNSEGLLLITSSGKVSSLFERSQMLRTYRVRVFGTVDMSRLSKIYKGITIDGFKYRGILIEQDRNSSDGKNSWLTVTLQEGKNREIRRVMDYFGLQVNRLIRTSYGPYQLGKVAPGGYIKVDYDPVKISSNMLKIYGEFEDKIKRLRDNAENSKGNFSQRGHSQTKKLDNFSIRRLRSKGMDVDGRDLNTSRSNTRFGDDKKETENRFNNKSRSEMDNLRTVTRKSYGSPNKSYDRDRESSERSFAQNRSSQDRGQRSRGRERSKSPNRSLGFKRNSF